MTKSIAAALTATMLLAGCATVPSDCPEPTPIPAEVQAAAADELSALPEGSALSQVVVAALNDRDKLRACRAIR